MPTIVNDKENEVPPPRIREKTKEMVKMGFPSWGKILIRGSIAIGLIFFFSVLRWFEPVISLAKLDSLPFAVFLASCIGLAMILVSGFLLITNRERKPGSREADIPAMLLMVVKCAVTIFIIYLAELLGILPDFAREFVVSVFSTLWAIFIVGNYIYHAFHRIY